MRWWARIGREDSYGLWVPTGQVNKADARDYIKEVYLGENVLEWLQL